MKLFKFGIAAFMLAIGLGTTAAEYQPAPLKFKGKEIFLLGDWDSHTGRETYSVHPLVKNAGMNCVVLGYSMSDRKRHEEDLKLLKWFNRNHPDIAIIIDLDRKFILKTVGERFSVPVPAEELAERRAIFKSDLEELSKLENVLGYTIDELENSLSSSYPEWKKTQKNIGDSIDIGITRYMETAIGWVVEDIKKYHPTAYFMPLQAWWTTYGESDKLFDVLIANEYPVTADNSLEGTFYTVAYDSQLAAAAVKKLNKQCFIYCPPGFDDLKSGAWKDRPSYSIDEIRYTWFTPITFGAQGAVGWRLRRCSEQFAQKTITPVMSEIHALLPWIMGERIDDKVTCNRNDMIDYKVPKRSRMTTEDNGEFNIRSVKAISYIVRRNPTDGSILLLVANNSNKNEMVQFSFSDLPVKTGTDALSGQTITVEKRTKVTFKPYGIKAFVLQDYTRQN